MGVTGLPVVLADVTERRHAREFLGQRLAVDLSLWIHHAVPMNARAEDPYPHVRLVFRRVARLYSLGIRVVAVVDGAPPKLKLHAISERRHQIQRAENRALWMDGGAPPGSGKGKGGGKGKKGKAYRYLPRGKLANWSKECADVLRLMGVPVVQAPGEAEATCVALEQANLVDGVITSDTDALLFGARRVVIKMDIAKNVPPYFMFVSADAVAEKLGLRRNQLIAYAALCGSDYFQGVHGVGQKTALRALEGTTDSTVLDTLRSWVPDGAGAGDGLRLSQSSVSSVASVSTAVRKVQGCLHGCEGFPHADAVEAYLDPSAVKVTPEFVAARCTWTAPQVERLRDHASRTFLEKNIHQHAASIAAYHAMFDVLSGAAVSPRPTDEALPVWFVCQGDRYVEVEWTLLVDPDPGKADDAPESSHLTTREAAWVIERAYPELVDEFHAAKASRKTRVAQDKAAAKAAKAAERERVKAEKARLRAQAKAAKEAERQARREQKAREKRERDAARALARGSRRSRAGSAGGTASQRSAGTVSTGGHEAAIEITSSSDDDAAGRGGGRSGRGGGAQAPASSSDTSDDDFEPPVRTASHGGSQRKRRRASSSAPAAAGGSVENKRQRAGVGTGAGAGAGAGGAGGGYDRGTSVVLWTPDLDDAGALASSGGSGAGSDWQWTFECSVCHAREAGECHCDACV